MSKITPFLWFDNNAQEAVAFYRTVFKQSEVRSTLPGPGGVPMTIAFTLNGQDFVALNGGPHFKFTEAVSFVVECKDQTEVDYYWDKLVDGGKPSQCGWLKDKFGLSWQIVPADFIKMVTGPDKEGSKRAMAALMKMAKIDLGVLKKAYDGE
ncbi:MAG: 3-demethylubiquinone-9 3-methyltransferase [Phycisphaerales bacterium]|nr:3-demethylubiquinone-9 3-methyltransferase [Phycisphaerales bacterium]